MGMFNKIREFFKSLGTSIETTRQKFHVRTIDYSVKDYPNLSFNSPIPQDIYEKSDKISAAPYKTLVRTHGYNKSTQQEETHYMYLSHMKPLTVGSIIVQASSYTDDHSDPNYEVDSIEVVSGFYYE